eukprot:Pgem_evm1s3485
MIKTGGNRLAEPILDENQLTHLIQLLLGKHEDCYAVMKTLPKESEEEKNIPLLLQGKH